MSIASYAAQCRVLVLGGRRYVCRPPTVETVRRFLVAFGYDALALREMARKGNEVVKDYNGIIGVLSVSKLAPWVLESCVTLWGSAPGETEESLTGNAPACADLMRALCTLCDVEAIAKSITLPEPTDVEIEKEEDGPDNQDVAVCCLAREYGVAPHTVVDWPYETFVTALEVLALANQGEQAKEQMSGMDAMQIPGIGYSAKA